MTKVVVIGGGVAGAAAAIAANHSGARVTLIESSSTFPPNKSFMPYLLSGRLSSDDLLRSHHEDDLAKEGIDVRLGERVERVDAGEKHVAIGDLQLPFDSLVIASGSEYVRELPKGFSKRNAFVMKRPDDYLSLARSASGFSHIAITGPAPLTLRAASELSSRVKVSAFLGRKGMSRFSGGIHKMITEAARLRDVTILETGVETVVGVKHVEAVISERSVMACDAAAVFPNSRPIPPEVDCLKGPHGGLVVDQSMRTSSRAVLAAGDCTELSLGASSFPFRLDSSALVMGEAAGKNAAGSMVRAGISGSLALDLFGIEVCVAGLASADASSLGLSLTETESEERVKDDPFGNETLRTSIIFENETRRILGLQAAGASAFSHSDYISAVVARRLTLEELVLQESAYLPHFNRDVSPIRLTAAKALAGR